MKYIIDFLILVLLYIFVFLRKWRAKGKAILLVNTLMYVYLSFVLCLTLMPVITAGHIAAVFPQMLLSENGTRSMGEQTDFDKRVIT